MPQFLDFQAAVVVDGAELPEYMIEVNEANGEISCYIPSEVGKNFAVVWRDLKLKRDIVGAVHLDGVPGGVKQIYKDCNRRKAERSYYRVSDEVVRPFCFAPLSLTDDENCADQAGNSLGEVRLELHKAIRPYQHAYDGKEKPLPRVATIHERSKKAMTHCVGYGADTKNVPTKWISCEKGQRLATFVFRYRSLDMLQAQDIAPRPQSSSLQRERKSEGSQDGAIIEIMDDSEDDRAELEILKKRIGKIEARLLKRQRIVVKSEDNAPVLKGENEAQFPRAMVKSEDDVEERPLKRQRTIVKSEDKALVSAYEIEVIELE